MVSLPLFFFFLSTDLCWSRALNVLLANDFPLFLPSCEEEEREDFPPLS